MAVTPLPYAEAALELYMPTGAVLENGVEDYLRYLQGLAYMNDPEGTQPYHRLPYMTDAQKEILIVTAEDMMWKGLRGVAESANPPERLPLERKVPLKEKAESHFDEALPGMLLVRKIAYDEKVERIRGLNPRLDTVRPLPIRIESVYKAICHGRREKTRTRQLLEGFGIAPLLDRAVENDRRIPDAKYVAAVLRLSNVDPDFAMIGS